ncbi:MAG: YbhN family protein [Acidimicrobiales bacterium]
MSHVLVNSARRAVKLLAFALVIHLFVIPQIGGVRKALSVIGSVNSWYLLGAVVLEMSCLLAYARLIQLLLPADQRPSLGVSFGTVMASTGVSHVVPGGAATTAAVNYRLLSRAGVAPHALSAALGLQAIGSAVVLNAILWLALTVSIPISGFHPVYATAATVGAVLIGVFSAAVVNMLRHRTRLADRVSALVGRLPRLSGDRVREIIIGLADQLRLLAADRHLLRLVVGLAAANWLLDAAALWLMLAAFGHRPGVVGVLVAYGLANVLAAIPVSPGGLGVIEAVLIPTLVGFGTPRAEASIGVVAYRLINFWLPIPLGALSYVIVERVTRGGHRGFVGEVEAQLQHIDEVGRDYGEGG